MSCVIEFFKWLYVPNSSAVGLQKNTEAIELWRTVTGTQGAPFARQKPSTHHSKSTLCRIDVDGKGEFNQAYAGRG